MCICDGYDWTRCPVCSSYDDIEMVECEACNGTGEFYYDEEGEEITRELYLTDTEFYLCDTCDECKGEGEIERY